MIDKLDYDSGALLCERISKINELVDVFNEHLGQEVTAPVVPADKPERRTFPIQANFRKPKAPAFRIPWSMAEMAYKTYSKFFGTSQSLEGLAERNGFGWQEFCLLYCGHNAANLPCTEVVMDCTQVAAAHLVAHYTVVK